MRKQTIVTLIIIIPTCMTLTSCEIMSGMMAGLEGMPAEGMEGGVATGHGIGTAISGAGRAVFGSTWDVVMPTVFGTLSWLAGKFGWVGKTGAAVKKGTVAAAKKVAGPKPDPQQPAQ